jgi:hypothetical protein
MIIKNDDFGIMQNNGHQIHKSLKPFITLLPKLGK